MVGGEKSIEKAMGGHGIAEGGSVADMDRDRTGPTIRR